MYKDMCFHKPEGHSLNFRTCEIVSCRLLYYFTVSFYIIVWTQMKLVLRAPCYTASSLPKDEEEFYQLCYVTINDLVCGASVPFQFRHPHEHELCAVEEQDGMVVVRSRTAYTEEKLREVISLNYVLNCLHALSTQKKFTRKVSLNGLTISECSNSLFLCMDILASTCRL